MGFFTINRRFFPMKLHYVLFNAGTVTVQPTMPVYAKVLGFSSFVVGVIYTILPILGLFIKPIFGAIADKLKAHRAVLVAWEIIIVVVYFAIQFIPPDKSVTSTALSSNGWSACESSSLHPYPYLSAEFGRTTWECELDSDICEKWNITSICNNYNVYNSTSTTIQNFLESQEQCISLPTLDIKSPPSTLKGCRASAKEASDADTYSQWQFWLFVFLLVGAWGGTSVVTTISDTICIEICEDPHLYGQQRLWGSVGWGVVGLITGYIIDSFSEDGQEKNYTPVFYMMLPFLLIDIVISYRLKFSIPQQSENIAKDVWKVLLKPRNAIFAFWCAMVGVSFGVVWNFLFWLLEDLATDYGADNNIKTIEGIVTFVQTVVGETPAFFMGGWIVNKIGHGHSLTLVLAAIGLRYTMYSILVNPWWSIPVEILQNNYGLFYSTMTSYAKAIATPGTEATIQSLLCAICEGVGVAIGSFLAGYLFDAYGGSYAFRIFGISFLVMALSNEGIEWIYRYLDKKDAMQAKQIAKETAEKEPTFTEIHL